MTDKLDKIVAITGASSGIGAATASHLAGMGARVYLGARREEKLVARVQQIKAAGGKAACRVLDVSDHRSFEDFVAGAQSEYGGLDILVNCAGIAPISPFAALKVDDWIAMIEVNLQGTLFGIAAVLPIFRKQQSGHVVNIISSAGLQISPTMGVYAATKNAVRTVTEALRQESEGLFRVTGISPGFVNTNLSDSMEGETRAALEQQMDEMGLSPEAIAKAVAYAVTQPDEVDINDIVVRPTSQA